MDEEISNFNFDKVLENQELILSNTIKTHVKSTAQLPVNVEKICCDCGDEIDQKRLDVLPQAIRCIDCAVDFEKRAIFKKCLNNTRSIIENINT